MHKLIKKLLGIIILAIFIGQFIGSAVMPHRHIINGVVVAHTHPYNVFSKHSHQHSQDEIILLHKLSHAIFITAKGLSVNTPLLLSLRLPITFSLVCTNVPSTIHYLLRAPPFVVFH